MKIELNKHFILPKYEVNMYDQLVSLEQGRLTVHEYIERFNELIVRCGVDESDKQALSRFRLGLRADIQREIIILHFSYFCY